MKILVAEDDRSSLALISAILKKGGHAVVKAADGGVAWDALQLSDAPRLAVLDWMMPTMDGLEVVRRVRALKPSLPPYLIMLTAKSAKTDVLAALATGANDILSKPFDAEELLARIEVGRRMVEAQDKLLAQSDELRQTHAQLAHAQKLEAVGQLAAGIAHEINTPTQFVSDSVHFLQDAFDDQRELIAAFRAAVQALVAGGDEEKVLEGLRQAEETADFEFLEGHVPGSFERCFDGLSRISTIVGAMKEFAHPDEREQSPADLNQALSATLAIARNEYKYVADVETAFSELPLVVCHLGDLNQVFLNLLVNAAHAIGEVIDEGSDGGASDEAGDASGQRGMIRVRTAHDGDSVRIEIEDTGSGIPESIQQRIFDPFFTTKEVGKGSGQGLAIAHSIVVDKHGGTLCFDSAEGRGTTFTIRIPVSGKRRET